MQMLMAAWTSQTVAAVTRLGVPDLIHAHGPLTAHELTGRHGVDARPEHLERALRACAGAGIFTESPEGRFGATPRSEVLTLASPASVKPFAELIGGRWWTLFGGLPEALRTGESQARALLGPEPTGPARTRQLEEFAQAMRSRVDSTRGAVEGHDFSDVTTLVDVGGGLGHLAIAVLRRHPRARALVLDLPDVIALAERDAAGEPPDVRARLSFVGGDMFADVPPGDCYVLKAIVHDWDDARARRVLANCRARLTLGGRVLCVDNVLPPMGDTGGAGTKLLDMLMMVSLPGKERTEAEWRALYEAAGLRLTSITLINPRSGESIIQGVPAEATR